MVKASHNILQDKADCPLQVNRSSKIRITTTITLNLTEKKQGILTHCGRGHLNCLNARSRGSKQLKSTFMLRFFKNL
jgi:hypothetical protein